MTPQGHVAEYTISEVVATPKVWLEVDCDTGLHSWPYSEGFPTSSQTVDSVPKLHLNWTVIRSGGWWLLRLLQRVWSMMRRMLRPRRDMPSRRACVQWHPVLRGLYSFPSLQNVSIARRLQAG